MQNITIAGRIGQDAETRPAGDGNVCSFSVAVDSRQGREKITNWWRVSLWGKRGDALAQYLTKGSNVTVNGEFSLTEYQGKPQLNLRANEVSLQGGGQSAGDRQQARGGSSGGFASDDLSDDVPF
jgi:single-strand DNA-binding protein